MNEKITRKKPLSMRILLSLMLVMCMALMIMPLNTMKVSADTGDVSIAGTKVSDSVTTYWKNKGDKSGVEGGSIEDYNAMYEPASGGSPAKLTLKGLNITNVAGNGICVEASDLEIVLVNENIINNTRGDERAIFCKGCTNSNLLTISGTGSLNVTVRSHSNPFVSSVIRSDGDLVINGGTLTVTAGETTAESNYGIRVNDFTINNGTVNATGGPAKATSTARAYGSSIGILTEKSSAAAKDGNFTVNGGEVTATGGAASGKNNSDNSVGIYSEGDFNINAGKVTARGGSANYECDSMGLSVDGNFTATGGTVNATGGDGTTPYNGNGNGNGSYGIAILGTFKISDGTVNGVSGIPTGNYSGVGIYAYSSLTSTGGAATGTGHDYGIVTGDYEDTTVKTGTITIDNGGQVTGTGAYEGVSTYNSGINVKNGKLTGTSTSVDSIGIGIHAKGNLTVSGTGSTGGVVEAHSNENASPTDPVRTAIQAASIVLKGNRAVTTPANGTVKNGMVYNKSGDTLQSNAVISQAEHFLDITAPVFETAKVGYERPAAAPFTVKNEGSENAENITMTLDAAGEDYFDISYPQENNIIPAAQINDSQFTIQPKVGLKAGTYTAKVTFSYTVPDSPDYSKASTVTFKVAAPTDTATDTATGAAAKTGDDSNMILIIVIACIALAGAGAALAFRNKGKRA